ncbi:hypothetical protein AG1IA_06433 [Rhizoctonia solani AG-1 IA]|uniref:Uncharacterized protein n=1 Tax=Thanatephorus cucumeris (strain AG1-IA) TaxID=983506 RepID=L8WRV8_THACA|nr:hypothetical protein AG1IA_06433 [Rhizoctonia solani AG-1 IA]
MHAGYLEAETLRLEPLPLPFHCSLVRPAGVFDGICIERVIGCNVIRIQGGGRVNYTSTGQPSLGLSFHTTQRTHARTLGFDVSRLELFFWVITHVHAQI